MQIPRTLPRMVLLALALATPAVGRAEPVPVDSIIENSDAIVLGRLTIVDLVSTETEEKGTGYITVEKVVAGRVEVGESVPLGWHFRFDPEVVVVCPTPIHYQPLRGVLGVWFLERGEDGTLRPNGEAWSLEDPQSLDYHATELASLKPRTKRTSLLLSIVKHRLKDS